MAESFSWRNSLPRCPKCDALMKPVECAPRFAQFLPWRSFNCDRCRIALGYPPDEDEGDK
jgi:hypothetical protein